MKIIYTKFLVVSNLIPFLNNEKIKIKGENMRYFILILLFITTLSSSVLTDQAYKAYKNRHYKKALELYKRATKSGSLESQIKAEYNLGVFYLRGIGTPKDKKEALKHFRRSYLMGQGIPVMMDRVYYSTQAIKIQRDTHNYLAKLESDPALKAKHKKSAALLNRKLKERKARKEQKEQLSPYTKKFLRHCKAARVVAPADRKDLEILDCSLYKRYPKRLKHYFHHRKAYRQAREHYRDNAQNRAYKAMVRDLAPILRNYLKKEIQCVKKAKTQGELFKCNLNYLGRLDTLLFRNYTSNIADAMVLFSTKKEKEEREKHFKTKITPQDRSKMIQGIKKMLSSHKYVPSY